MGRIVLMTTREGRAEIVLALAPRIKFALRNDLPTTMTAQPLYYAIG